MQDMRTYTLQEETLEALQEVFAGIEGATDLFTFALADIDRECGRNRAKALQTVKDLLADLCNKGSELTNQIEKAPVIDPGQEGGQL